MSQTEAEIVECLAAEFDRTLDIVQFSQSHALLDVAVHSMDYRVALTRLYGLPGDYEILLELHLDHLQVNWNCMTVEIGAHWRVQVFK